jgi:DNA-binding NarL/FixJ family response regulator
VAEVDSFFNNISHQKTNITILATYALTRSSLQSLLENDHQLNVLDVVGTTAELIEKVSRNKPDVTLICLLENENENIAVVTDLLKAAPKTKIVILCSPNNLPLQAAALRFGVAGIVGANQSGRVLSRAIKQISAGEVWLNQNLVARLLEGNSNSTSDIKYKDNAYFKGDTLTRRELEIVKMIGLGLKNKDISKKLCISEITVRQHLSSIYGKLNIEDRLNLAIYAYRQRIVSPSSNSI